MPAPAHGPQSIETTRPRRRADIPQAIASSASFAAA